MVRIWLRYKFIESRQEFALPSRFRTLGKVIRAIGGLGWEVIVQLKWLIMGIPLFPESDRFDLLDVAIRAAPPTGLWLEFGVWKGDSINFISQRSSETIFGFDSFLGLPTNWGVAGKRKGTFSTGGNLPSVNPNVRLVKGWFGETLPSFLMERPSENVVFLHIDCDLYSSAREVLAHLGRRVSGGSIVVFDEFCGALLGDDESRAWREFCQQERIIFRWLGSSLDGSVALKVVAAGRSSPYDRRLG